MGLLLYSFQGLAEISYVQCSTDRAITHPAFDIPIGKEVTRREYCMGVGSILIVILLSRHLWYNTRNTSEYIASMVSY